MSGWIKFSVIAATATAAALPLVMPQAAIAQGGVYIGPQYPQQAQQPPRGGRDGIPNTYDRYDNNRRRGGGDQDYDGVRNRYDRDRDGDGRPNQWDRAPANPHVR